MMNGTMYSDGLSQFSYLAEIHQGCQIIRMPLIYQGSIDTHRTSQRFGKSIYRIAGSIKTKRLLNPRSVTKEKIGI